MSEHPAHFPLSPSGASRWLACPGSIELCRGRESEESSYAREGTIAHAIAADMLADLPVAAPTLCNRCNREVASPPCAGCGSPEYRRDVDMLDHVSRYVDYIQSIRSTCDILHEAIENKVVSQSIADFGGTIDYYVIYRDGESGSVVLHVVDLKYGAGLPVSPAGNKQLGCYLLLVREAHPNIQQFRATIVQPRAGDGQPQTVDVSREWLDRLAAEIGDASQSTTLQSGDHCRWCAAKPICPALQDHALEVAKAAFAHEPAMLEDTAELVELLKKEKVVLTYFEAVKAHLLAELQRGREIPGVKAVESTGHRRWIHPDEDTITQLCKWVNPATKKKVAKKDITAVKLKSPAELDRLGLGPLLGPLVSRSDLGYRLKLADEPGKAVTFRKPEELFGEVADISDML